MKPYFEREGATLYHGDCEAVAVECDLIVTDPPYGQNFVSNRRESESFGALVGDDNGAAIVAKLVKVMRALRVHRHLYIFGSHKLDLSSLPIGGRTELIWDKGMIGSGNLAAPWGPAHENILFGVYVPSAANRASGDGKLAAKLRKGSVLRSQRANSGGVKLHPTEKPVDILRQMIESSSVIGETVYDPFAGSGSTLVAAALEGRRAVGCEIEERYCEVAAKRLEKVCPELIEW